MKLITSGTFFIEIHHFGSYNILEGIDKYSEARAFKKLILHPSVYHLIAHDLTVQGPITLFLPSDKGIAMISEKSMQAMLEDRDKLISFLRHHIVPEGGWRRRDLIGSDYQPWVRFLEPREAPVEVHSLLGHRIPVSVKRQGGIAGEDLVEVGGFPLVRTDLKCQNGIIHLMDGVLQPDWKLLKEEASFEAEQSQY